ncbi:MAG: carboxypeptidase-like regulatory domain-containing protein, partial [Flavobacteriales bacterium]
MINLKKSLLLFAFAMGVVVPLLAQKATVKGKMSSETGEVLAFSTVQIEGTDKGAVADVDGLYSLEIEEGTYNLIGNFLGYEPKTQQVIIESGEVMIVNFILNEMEIQIGTTDDLVQTNESLEAITLEGMELVKLSSASIISVRSTASNPIAHTNVKASEIAKINNGQDLPYMLRFTPSLVVTSDAGAGVGYTGLRIRGSDATRINVTINGIPVNDSEAQGVFWVNMPDLASSVDNIQIQRGVGTSTNG